MKKTVLVDLDGVLADYSRGFQGIENIGDPIPGAVEFTKQLATFARVVIFTTRCKAYPEGTPGPSGCPEPDRSSPERLAGIVKAWLDRHGFVYDEVYTGQGKPFNAAIIDDRAVCCRPQSPWVGKKESDVTVARSDVYAETLATARNFCEG